MLVTMPLKTPGSLVTDITNIVFSSFTHAAKLSMICSLWIPLPLLPCSFPVVIWCSKPFPLLMWPMKTASFLFYWQTVTMFVPRPLLLLFFYVQSILSVLLQNYISTAAIFFFSFALFIVHASHSFIRIVLHRTEWLFDVWTLTYLFLCILLVFWNTKFASTILVFTFGDFYRLVWWECPPI